MPVLVCTSFPAWPHIQHGQKVAAERILQNGFWVKGFAGQPLSRGQASCIHHQTQTMPVPGLHIAILWAKQVSSFLVWLKVPPGKRALGNISHGQHAQIDSERTAPHPTWFCPQSSGEGLLYVPSIIVVENDVFFQIREGRERIEWDLEGGQLHTLFEESSFAHLGLEEAQEQGVEDQMRMMVVCALAKWRHILISTRQRFPHFTHLFEDLLPRMVCKPLWEHPDVVALVSWITASSSLGPCRSVL